MNLFVKINRTRRGYTLTFDRGVGEQTLRSYTKRGYKKALLDQDLCVDVLNASNHLCNDLVIRHAVPYEKRHVDSEGCVL